MAGKDAFGTEFRRGDGEDPEVFATIANVTSISGPDRSRETINVTAHDSPDQYMEKIGGLRDAGEISFTLNYDPTDTSMDDLEDDFNDSGDPRNYQVVLLPDTVDEHTWALSAIVTGLSDEFPHDDKMSREVTLAVSGKPTLSLTGTT